MLQIKTVICPIESPKRFDDEVNRLLSNGWALRRREIQVMAGLPSEAFNAPSVRALYAELERHEPPFPEEITN